MVTITLSNVRVTMPLATPSAEDCVSKELHAHFAKVLLKHEPKHFKWTLVLAAPNSRVDIDIDRELAAKLPVLAPLLQSPDSPPCSPQCKVARVSSEGASDTDTKDTQHTKITVPFDAPASPCGLACLLLLLDNTAGCSNLFLSQPWGQSLASETAWVRIKCLQGCEKC